MSNFDWIQQAERESLAQTYGRYPVALKCGKGAHCEDVDGKTYIDFTSGIGVNALGYCDDGWMAAVDAQLHTIQHACNLFYTAPMVEVAGKLTERTGLKRVFFANSGAEANEGAIKAARKYGFDKYGEAHTTIVTLKNSFHGRTITTLSATGQDVFHNYFFPFTAGFKYATANDWDDTLSAVDDGVCAVMIEMIQGEGGVVPLERGYVAKLAALCAERDVLLIVDEVQTGMGRTGSLFAYQQFGLKPDIVTAAKGLGAGLPIGAVLLGEKVRDTLSLGQHGTTFGGNPVVCAGASHVLDRMDEQFLGEVGRKAALFTDRLNKMPGVQSVTGMGLMLGIELEKANAKDVANRCVGEGLLILTAKHKVRLLPPLNIPDADIEAGLNRLESAIAKAEKP